MEEACLQSLSREEGYQGVGSSNLALTIKKNSTLFGRFCFTDSSTIEEKLFFFIIYYSVNEF